MGEFVQGFRLADKVEWVYKAASVAGTDLVEDVPRAPLRVGEAFVSGGPSVGRCGCWRSMPARQVVVQLAGVVIVHDHSIHLLIVLSALFGQETILTFVAREAGDPRAHQATWEAFMAFLAIRHFVSPTVRGRIGTAWYV